MEGVMSAVRIVNLAGGELTAERERWLVDGLVAALPELRMRELFTARLDMFHEADLITVAVADDAAIGALASRWATLPTGEPFLHVTSQFVGNDHRGSGVFLSSWAAHLHTLCEGPLGFPAVSVLKTYNPVVFCAMRNVGRIAGVGCYPSLDLAERAGPIGRSAAGLATRIARTIAAGHPFDPATGVITGAGVPRDLYPSRPRSADRAVNEYFAAAARPGDRILCMLRVPTSQAVSTLMRFFSAARHLDSREAATQ